MKSRVNCKLLRWCPARPQLATPMHAGGAGTDASACPALPCPLCSRVAGVDVGASRAGWCTDMPHIPTR